jgi:hypothetical protein
MESQAQRKLQEGERYHQRYENGDQRLFRGNDIIF